MKMKSLMKGILALTVLFSVALGVLQLPKFTMVVNAEEIVASGTCGDPNVEEGKNVTWSLDDEGTLTISGTGKMVSYNTASAYPWYGYKDSIKSVVIEDGVTSTGAGFVYGYTTIESVSLPDTLTEIGSYSFYNCSFEEITIPFGVTKIEDYVFIDCSNLEKVSIPESVKEIGISAFYDCTSLNNIDFPSELKTIARNAFNGCSSLTDVTIPSSVEILERLSFCNCSSLKSVTFEDGDTPLNLEYDSFFNCTSLEMISIPSRVVKMSGFSGCSNLINIKVDKSNENYKDIDGVLFDKSGEKLIYYPLGKMKTKYTIPDGVTTIGICAFEGNERLEEIIISNGVTTIDERAFKNCTSLKDIIIPNGVTTINAYAFGGCVSLKEIVIPASVTNIDDLFILDIITHIALPELEKIEVDSANPNYKSIDGVLFKKDGDELSLYSSCPRGKVGGFVIPDGITSIPYCFFRNCSKLTNIYIPLSVENTGDYWLEGCSSLTSLEYGGTVEQWESNGRKYIEIPDDIPLEYITCTDGKLINNGDITGCDVSTIPDQIYTGDSIEPLFDVTYKSYSLEKDKDYSVEFSDNIDVGEASVTIKCTKGSFKYKTKTLLFNILPKEVTSPTIILSQDSFVYDGQEHKPTVTLKDGDKVIDASEYTVKYSDDCTKAGEKTITITDNDGGNYTVSGTGSFAITPKPLNVTGLTASDKIYDGTTDVEISGTPALDEVIDGDDVSITSGKAEFKDANAGTAKEIVLTGFTLSGNDKDNYELKTTATASITPKEVTVSGIKAQNKSYDGTTTASLDYTGVTFNGKLDNDLLTVTATGAFSSKEAGTDKNVSISNLTLGGASAGNYKLANDGNQTYAKASITACVHSKTEVRNKVDATKTSKGYTGDTYCQTCGKLLSKGKDVEKLPDDSDKKDKTSYSNEWVDGKWYNADGICDYAGTLSWKNDETGWWVEDSEGWYPVAQWQKIDGKWYYFTESGYMDYSEYRDGCWLGSDGAWVEEYYGGHWCSNSSGWWYEDSSGWYPVSQYVWIDGTEYWFGADGYWK